MMKLIMSVSLVIILITITLASAQQNSAPPSASELTRSLFESVIEERESGKHSSEKWLSRAREVKDWGKNSIQSVMKRLSKECLAERTSTNRWIADLKAEFSQSESETQMELSTQSHMGEGRQMVVDAEDQLRVMLENVNDSIQRTNSIFSTTHLMKVTDVIAKMFNVRTSSFQMRSAHPEYKDPILDEIQTAVSNSDNDGAETSFLDLSALHESRMNRVSSELSLETEVPELNRISDLIDRVENDVDSWKSLRDLYEQERSALGTLRDELLAAYEKLDGEKSNLKRAKDDVSSSSATTIAGQHALEDIIPMLETHLSTISTSCDGFASFVSTLHVEAGAV